MKTKNEYTAARRAAHHAALDTLSTKPGADGLKLWRALRRIESDAHAAMTAQCNGAAYGGQPYREEENMDIFCDSIRARVKKAMGKLPPGFVLNHDPRGYALKLEEGNVPQGMETDWGLYGILAAEIN